MGIDAVLNSLSGLTNDLNQVGTDWITIWEALPQQIRDMIAASQDSTRETSSSGIANASQDSVDELNGRATAIQGHTYSISENTKLLLNTANLILNSVLNIESNTDGLSDRVAGVENQAAQPGIAPPCKVAHGLGNVVGGCAVALLMWYCYVRKPKA